MAHVVHDPAVFVNETEYHTRTGKRVSNLQQQVEEPDLYLLAASSSSGSGLILNCLDCLLELSEPLCTCSGIQISGTLKFFLGEWGVKHPTWDASALSILVSLHDQHHLDASMDVPTKCPRGCTNGVSIGQRSGVQSKMLVEGVDTSDTTQRCWAGLQCLSQDTVQM